MIFYYIDSKENKPTSSTTTTAKPVAESSKPSTTELSRPPTTETLKDLSKLNISESEYKMIQHSTRANVESIKSVASKSDIMLESNFYPIELDPKLVVYHYDFSIVPEIKNKIDYVHYLMILLKKIHN